MSTFREFMRGKNIGRVMFNRIAGEHVKLEGTTLDFGSAQKMSYYRFMDTSKTRIFRADLAKGKDVSVLLNLEDSLPFRDNSVDNVVLFAILEHIYDPRKLLDEIRRILKRQGKLYLSVPFMSSYHPSPHDYNRYTKEKLERMLDRFHIEKTETIGGFFTVFGYNFTTYFLGAVKVKHLRNFLTYSFYLFSQAMDRKISKIKGEYIEKFPLMYFIVAKKQS
jgi:SAM-dependent methyltransferase